MPVAHVGLSRGPRPFPNGFRTGRTTTVTPITENLASNAGVLTISTSGSSLTSLATSTPYTRRDLPHPRLFFGRRHGRRHS